MRAVCLGECMVELREAGSGLMTRGFAGDAYNTAVYLGRSAPRAEVQFITTTGEGSLSQAMRATWRAEGVDDALAFATATLEPGLYLIELDASGERKFHYWRSNSAARQWMRGLEAAGGAALLAGADLIYLSGVSLAILDQGDRAQALAMLRALKGRVGHVAFDPNVRPALWRDLDTARAAVKAAAGVADILLPSREDLALLYRSDGLEDSIAELQGQGAAEIALTLGAEGCMVVNGEARTKLPARSADVIDTSGAGDAFNGAYLAARLAGATPVDAAQAGLAVSARVVTYAGAIVPISISHPKDA